ncbi:RusA family crossover junction endodeoxyribonuclease [Ruegeria pomeroyi]|nr:RusA family crossover junction endodeoxyribonuclease [Ruegeria pomeroyi]
MCEGTIEADEDVEILLPIGFAVRGTPVSLQSKNAKAKQAWKKTVLTEARQVVPRHKWAITDPLSITIYDFPDIDVQGDVDNIVKLTIDALWPSVFSDDSQVKRIVAQRFSQIHLSELEAIRGDFPELVATALGLADPPFVFVYLSNEIYGDVK